MAVIFLTKPSAICQICGLNSSSYTL